MIIPMNKYLNIDYVRDNNVRLYYFGLGFIQVVFNQYNRVHYYNPELGVITDSIHNHRYNFESTILKGELLEQTFRLVEGNTHILENESCGRDIKLPYKPTIETGVVETTNNRYIEGSVYHRPYNEFHRVEAIGRTITHLKRSDIILDYAQVLISKREGKVCPFSKKYEEDYLYQIIEDTINK